MPEGYNRGKPDVGYWLRQIRHGIEYRKQAANEANWRLWRQYYRGQWDSQILPSNVFFKMLRTVVPRIYFRNPSISITPAKPGLENIVLAKILERTDNKLIRNGKIKKQMKRMVQDAWMFGTGVGKKGFGSEYQSTPQPVGTTVPPDASKPSARLSEFVEYNYDIQANMPWFLRVSPGDFVVPAGLDYIENARWVAFKIVRPTNDVKADPRLKNTASLGSSLMDVGDRNFKHRMRQTVDLLDMFEVHDKKTGMVFIISPSSTERTLLFEESEFARLQINVASTLVFNDDDEYFWGIPDSQILEPLQLEANEVKTYMMYHRRLSIARILARRNALTEEEALKLVGPDVMPVVSVDGDPRTSIQLQNGIDIPAGLIQMESLVSNEVRETLGFSRNEFGEFRPGSRSPTATETRKVSDASAIRVDERRDMVADLLVEVITDFHPIIFNHWTEEQVEEIIGPAGIPFWIRFRPSMLSKINYNIAADPDQAAPQTKELREAKALRLYEILKTNPLIDPTRLTQYLLKEMHGVQFDDMMIGLPTGAGLTPQNPITPQQFAGVLQNVAKRNPQLLTNGLGKKIA